MVHRTNLKIIISGIGTGGHYFPALVVAREFRKNRKKVIFLVRRGFTEERIARTYGVSLFYIKAQPYFGKSLLTKFKFFLSLFYSTIKLITLTRHAIGFAFGGFGSLSLVLACLFNRRRFYIFEPNRIPGQATRFFAGRAQTVFLGLPLKQPLLGYSKITGIPIRSGFKSKHPPANLSERPLILFIGASQGARTLNRLALELQDRLLENYRLKIITGTRDYDWVIKEKTPQTQAIAFTKTPWQDMAEAELVVSRAGALSGYELLALNKKVIFIPFPYAVDNHQYYNARYFCENGTAVMIEEKELDAKKLLAMIETMLKKKPSSRCKLILNAEEKIVQNILEEN